MGTVQDELLADIARALDEIMPQVYGKRMGFALLVFPFNSEPDKGVAADYVSNAKRVDMIRALREAADRFESNEIIGVPQGSA